MLRWTLCASLTLLACRSASARVEREDVAREMHARAGVTPLWTDAPYLPAGVEPDNGLTLDEAIALALWRNPDLAAHFAELEVARSAVVEAGLLRDPVFTLLLPLGPKQLESTLNLPIDALWLRPRRIELAQDDAERLAAGLLQHGLDLVRDVQLAFAELALAKTRARIAAERARLWLEVARLEQVRVAAGEATSAVAREALASARIAEEQARVEGERVDALRLRLAAHLGSDPGDADLEFEAPPARASEEPPTAQSLLPLAFACRPDLRAAELGIEAAAKRLGLARAEAWRVTAILDANDRDRGGLEAGPGLTLGLPVFTGSRRAQARARAELDLAAARYEAVRARVENEVLAAAAELQGALRARADWTARIGPESAEALQAVRRAHAGGGVSALDELRATLSHLQVALHQAEALARVWRARAELERSVGRHALEPGGGRS